MTEIRFPCQICTQVIVVPDSSREKRMDCPGCGAQNVVPPVGRLGKVELYFLCGNCEQSLVVEAEGQGTMVECPRCQGATIVPEIGELEGGQPKPPEIDLKGAALTPEEVAYLSGQSLP